MLGKSSFLNKNRRKKVGDGTTHEKTQPPPDTLHTEAEENLLQKQQTHFFADLVDSQDENEFMNVLEDGRVTRFNYQRFKAIELACNYFSILGVILSVYQFDKEFENPDSAVNICLLWFILITTIILVILSYFKYYVLMKFQTSQKNITSKDNLKSSGLLNDFILEMIIQIPIPFIAFNGMHVEGYDFYDRRDFSYTVNSWLSLWILLRIPLFMQTIFNQTIYASHRSQRIGKMYGCPADWIFALKCIMKNSPGKLVFSLIIMTIFVFGHALRICERASSSDQNLGYYWNCMWLVILTMTTVGYGDFVPTTILGRVVLFMVCIWGICLLSLMVIAITNVLKLNNLEKKAMNLIMRLSKRNELKIQAAEILTLTAKFSIHLKKNNVENRTKETKNFANSLKKKLNDFKNLRRQIKTGFESIFSEDLDMNFFFLIEDLKVVENNIDRQISLAKGVADKLKIKYDDIFTTENDENLSKVAHPANDSMSKIGQEPDLKESLEKLHRFIQPKSEKII